MTDLMQTIYEYIEEACYREYLPREYYRHHQRVLEAADSALHDTLSEEQWRQLEKYTQTLTIRHAMELEAMFQAAWAAARELG